jgi:hypothetical protein
MTTLGFFGDSFCAARTSEHSLAKGYQTYIDIVADKLAADIVHLGYPGTSVWDLVLKQLNPLIETNTLPDVLVFCWTNPPRIYHPTVRGMNIQNISVARPPLEEQPYWAAADQYFKCLLDFDKNELEYRALMYYVDTVILPQIPEDRKIIHLWSFGYPSGRPWQGLWSEWRPSNLEYHYAWTRGVEIRPSLMSLSVIGRSLETNANDPEPNHLGTELKNQLVAGWITEALESYSDGLLIDRSQDVEALWK